MEIYVLTGEYGEYSDKCVIIEGIYPNLVLACDYLLLNMMGKKSEWKTKINNICTREGPSHTINCSLEHFHEKKWMSEILRFNENIIYCIDNYKITEQVNPEYECASIKTYNENGYISTNDQVCLCLYYNFTLKKFVLGKFDRESYWNYRRYPERTNQNNVVLNSSPLLDKLNKYFNSK